jgi:hypothetical protein
MTELKLKGDTEKDAESRAQNYYLYANGMYNMTWYGNASSVHASAISRDDYGYVTYERNEYLRTTNFFKCSEALLYYQKAAALTKNKEFRAKCTWMSAKCEHNLWIDANKDSEKAFVAGRYFQQMKTLYSNTEYYKDVINECGYFCTYITRSDSCMRNR